MDLMSSRGWMKWWWREARREAAIRRLGALDPSPSAELQHLVDLAAEAFGTPVALLSVVDGEALRFRATKGADIATSQRCDTFCHRALDRADDLLEVTEPTRDSSFAALPSVAGDPHVRYYFGAPLRLQNGMDVGALCVLDVRDHAPATEDQRAHFRSLARRAVTVIEARSHLRNMAA